MDFQYLRFERNKFGEGVILYVWDYVHSKQLTKNKLPDDIESLFIEVNLTKT